MEETLEWWRRKWLSGALCLLTIYTHSFQVLLFFIILLSTCNTDNHHQKCPSECLERSFMTVWSQSRKVDEFLTHFLLEAEDWPGVTSVAFASLGNRACATKLIWSLRHTDKQKLYSSKLSCGSFIPKWQSKAQFGVLLLKQSKRTLLQRKNSAFFAYGAPFMAMKVEWIGLMESALDDYFFNVCKHWIFISLLLSVKL